MESIAFQVYDVITAMQEDAGREITELRVDGGASANDFLMQFQSDLIKGTVTRSKVMETTALGAAYFSGLESGFWKDLKQLEGQWEAGKSFNPDMENGVRENLLNSWNKAVSRSLSWIDQE